MKIEKEIISGTELTYNNKTVYYSKRLVQEDYTFKHQVYFFNEGWPFPQYLILNREDFRIKRLEKEAFDMSKMDDAIF
jgi:hypothetical protein